MKSPFSGQTMILGLFLWLLCGALEMAGAQLKPEATKIEPPNWWAHHSINPVRVLIRGQHLQGCTVEVIGAGLSAGLTRVNAAGTYVFVDLEIETTATAGARALRLTTSGGVTEAPFEISPALDRKGRYQGFTPDDVIYFIMPDRFADGDPASNNPAQSAGLLDRAKPRYYHGGDFKGIIEHLPYLKDLGVTAIWLNPVYNNVDHLNEREVYAESPGGPNRPTTDYHGYGPVDFYAVEEHYGSWAELRQLVDQAHALGLKVIQDQVANHTGPYHPWAKDQPTPTWFNGTESNHVANTWQKWTAMNPRATPQTQRLNVDGWFINLLPDLNQNDEEVARYLVQNTLWWLGMAGFDALRMDTLPHVNRSFWPRWMTAIKNEYPRVTVLGELFDGDPALLAYFQGGRPGHDGIDTRIDTVFDFALFYAIRSAFAQGGPIRAVSQVYAHDWLYPRPEVLVSFLGVHDMARFMNEQGATIEGLKLAHAMLLTGRGTPLLYYGDEIAMPGGGDPDNRRDFPGGFPGDPRNAFTAAGREPVEQSVWTNLQRLLQLRRELEPLRRGRSLDLYEAEQQTAFARVTSQQCVLVAFNNDKKPATIEFSLKETGLPETVILKDQMQSGEEVTANRGWIKVPLSPRSVRILTEK
jgi:neopullulanase